MSPTNVDNDSEHSSNKCSDDETSRGGIISRRRGRYPKQYPIKEYKKQINESQENSASYERYDTSNTRNFKGKGNYEPNEQKYNYDKQGEEDYYPHDKGYRYEGEKGYRSDIRGEKRTRKPRGGYRRGDGIGRGGSEINTRKEYAKDEGAYKGYRGNYRGDYRGVNYRGIKRDENERDRYKGFRGSNKEFYDNEYAHSYSTYTKDTYLKNDTYYKNENYDSQREKNENWNYQEKKHYPKKYYEEEKNEYNQGRNYKNKNEQIYIKHSKEKKYDKYKDYEIPKEILIKRIEEDMIPLVKYLKETSDDEENESENSVNAETPFSSNYLQDEDCNDLLFETDTRLKIKMPYLIVLERNHSFMKRTLKNRSVRIIKRDNYYYLKSEDQEAITETKQKICDFMITTKISKIFEKKYPDPKLAIRSIVSSEFFKDNFFDLKRKYAKKAIHIEYMTSDDYYHEFSFLARKSQIITEKLKSKNQGSGFLLLIISSKENPEEIINVEENLTQILDEISEKNDIFYFNIKVPEIESEKYVTTEILNFAKKQDIAIKFTKNKNSTDDKFFIEEIIGAIFISKSIIKHFKFSDNLAIKVFCDFLKKFIKTEFELGEYKNVLIFKYFLQNQIEKKAKTMGIEIKLDELNFILKFNKNCLLYKEIGHQLKGYDMDYFEIIHEIKTFDMPTKISQLIMEEIYEKIIEIFSDENKIGGMIKEKINKINQETEKFIIIYEKYKILRKMGDAKANFSFQILYEINNRSNDIKADKKNKIQKYIDKFLTISFGSKDQVKFDEKKINQNYKCFNFRVKEFKDLIFLFGKKKALRMSQEYLNSQIALSINKVEINVKDFFSKSEIFKKLKDCLRIKKILEKDDHIEIKNNILIISTFSDKTNEKIQKISEYLQEFEKESIKIVQITDIYPNQIDYLFQNPEILNNIQEKYKVEIRINQTNTKRCHFEFVYDLKIFQLFNNDIEDFYADAIVNPQSEALLSSVEISEGVNKKILQKAGKIYEEELRNFIKTNKKLTPTSVLVTSAGQMNNYKKILNICVPVFENQSYKKNLSRCFSNIIAESEKNKFVSVALPLIGTGIYGYPVEEVFKTLLQTIQEQFFSKKMNYLNDIFLCEIDHMKIKKIQDLMSDFTTQNTFNQRKVKYIWKWLNDKKVSEEYDEYVNEKIDEAYEKYEKNKGNSIVEIYLNIFKNPGTHEFDFSQMNVIDISLKTTESLEKKNGNWYHNNEIYTNQVSEILNIKDQRKIMKFQLFLKSYYLDFEKMCQFNKITKFQRQIMKTPKIQDNIKKSDEFKLLNYDRPPIVYKDAKVLYADLNSIFITSYLGKGDQIEAEKEINNHVKNNFDKSKYKIPQNLSVKKIENLKSLCLKEKIYVNEELKPNAYVEVVGSKKSMLKFDNELEKADLPWDNQNIDYQLVSLNPLDEEYKIVAQSFKKSLLNQIVSIKKVQNNELYQSYQESLSRCKKLKEKNGMILNGEENYELLLWHGTGNTDPEELIDRKTAGLSTQYAKDSCMWGRGIYFAENASYSFNYRFLKKNTAYLLLCKVFVGETIKLNPDQSLKEPPYKDKDKKISYDSVQGETGGSIIYILYENNRNYPCYLVEFK